MHRISFSISMGLGRSVTRLRCLGDPSLTADIAHGYALPSADQRRRRRRRRQCNHSRLRRTATYDGMATKDKREKNARNPANSAAMASSSPVL